jgi:hypothetical protein
MTGVSPLSRPALVSIFEPAKNPLNAVLMQIRLKHFHVSGEAFFAP